MLNYKRTFIGILSVLTGALLVQACSRPLEPQESCNFVQNSQYQRVSWKGETIELYLDASVPYKYVGAIESAIKTWNTALGRNLIRLNRTGSGGAAYTPAKDGYSKIYWMKEWDPKRPNEQARTTVYWSGSRIYEADIRINNLNFDYFTSDEETDYTKVHLESLLVHEIGHVLGLAHTDSGSSVMYPNLANGYLRDNPSHIDLSSVKCEY